jgi:low affinity Fe/Cu permease
MNWALIIPISIAAAILIILLVIRNRKDKKNLVSKLENDYRKPRDEEGDIEIDEKMK